MRDFCRCSQQLGEKMCAYIGKGKTLISYAVHQTGTSLNVDIRCLLQYLTQHQTTTAGLLD